MHGRHVLFASTADGFELLVNTKWSKGQLQSGVGTDLKRSTYRAIPCSGAFRSTTLLDRNVLVVRRSVWPTECEEVQDLRPS